MKERALGTGVARFQRWTMVEMQASLRGMGGRSGAGLPNLKVFLISILMGEKYECLDA